MIHRLGSNLASFKALTFGPGLNILLADKSEGASDRQSRNGAGKTSFIELVHFLFGGNVNPGSIFRSSALRDWTFDVLVDVGEMTVTAARCGSKPSRILIDGHGDDWPVAPTFNLAAGRHELSNEHWKNALGTFWFGLQHDHTARFQPRVRSLFSLVARRQQSGGFLRPMQHSEKQQSWDQQVAICYLLGLDWTIPGRFQELKGQEKVARELRKTARSGELGRYFGRVADLRTGLTISDAHARRLRVQIDHFNVVPEYRALEREADRINSEIRDLNVENVVDHDLVRQLRVSLDTEDPPHVEDLTKLYAEAGIVLPGLPRRRLEDVERFHQTVIENRHAHLDAEITSTQARIVDRDRRRQQLDGRRRQVMELLHAGGALEHYTDMREELGRIEAASEMLRQRLETAERLESTQTELDLERTKLTQVLRDDIRERGDSVREAILTFEELSESLYEQAGNLTIADTPNGPIFEVHIDAERSKGITNIQIFCFDLMLTELSARHGQSPGFLIHDSHLFDGVDERQVAKALQLGAERAEASGFQYIVTMNSDSVPNEGFKAGFDIRNHFMETRLTDETDSGGLFGLRFN